MLHILGNIIFGEGTDLQVTFLEMNYMSYVYYVDDHQEWGGVQTTFAPHSSYRDKFMIWFVLFCFVKKN